MYGFKGPTTDAMQIWNVESLARRAGTRPVDKQPGLLFCNYPIFDSKQQQQQ